MHKSSIEIEVLLDPEKIPSAISWKASDTSAKISQPAKAMCLAFWDGADRSAMRIDLWTKEMMMDEMGEFFHQMLHTMADTFQRATKNEALAAQLKEFSANFIKQFREEQISENKI